jgi:hypothetical protein
MKGLQNNGPSPVVSSYRPRFMILVGISACMLLALVVSAWSGNLPFRAYAASSAHTSTTSTTGNYPITVYFSKSPDSLSQPAAVFSVDRTSPTIAVATFSIQLLIAGPTLSERNSGYFSELNSILSGPSTCSAPLPTGGPDFTLALNKKGSVTEQGTATLRFCRSTNSGGIGSDGRIQAEINATLKQFSNIKKVVILTKDGHCFGDESGMDLCLR